MSKRPTKIFPAVGAAAGASSVAGVGEFFKPLPSEHPFYEKIGKVIAGWAAIEHWLDEMIFDLYRNATRAEISCVTRPLNVKKRVDAITSSCKSRGLDSSLAKDVDSFSDALHDLSRQRNRIVHDAWYVSGADSVAQSRPQSREEQYGFKEITAEDLDKLKADIWRCEEKVRDSRTTLWKALKSQPDPADGMAIEDLKRALRGGSKRKGNLRDNR